jgi:hypothetical protein
MPDIGDVKPLSPIRPVRPTDGEGGRKRQPPPPAKDKPATEPGDKEDDSAGHIDEYAAGE